MGLSVVTWLFKVNSAKAACMSRECGRPGHGFIGFGINMYIPVCAYTCQYCFKSAMLECNMDDTASFPDMGGMGMEGMDMGGVNMPNVSKTPSNACHSQSKPFLTSVAWCIKENCGDYPIWKLEKWWSLFAVGNLPTDPPPMLSYSESVAAVTSPPTVVQNKTVVINDTQLVDPSKYTAIYIALDTQQDVEIQHEQFAMAIFLSGVGIPIVLSFISRFMPFPKRLASALAGRFNYALSFRPRRASPVANAIGDPPTRGQGLLVAFFILLNVFLSAFGFVTHPGGFGFWWNNGPDEIMGNLANRFGVLAFANFALLVLYSSRNNVLLWLTDWQFSTFVILHRWVGYIAILETILHSLIDLRDWIVQGRLAAAQITPFWYYGCIGTIAASLIIPFSLPAVRQWFYEPFLLIHIIFSILVFVGSWYHIIYEYQHQWGYETWLYIAFAIWAFDRLVRILRIARIGLRTATITPIDDDYVRIDIPGTVAQGHIYLYFLRWRFWENHPFSVASSVIHLGPDTHGPDSNDDSGTPIGDPESGAAKSESPVVSTATEHLETGIVLYLRLLDGETKALSNKSQVRVLIEGPYGSHEDLSEYTNLVCIAGGVGITACLPYLRAHPGHKRLYWGSRSQALIDSLASLTQNLSIETSVHKRLDIRSILEGQDAGDLAVVVSGPPAMMDETREIVSQLSKYRRIKFIAESFSY